MVSRSSINLDELNDKYTKSADRLDTLLLGSEEYLANLFTDTFDIHHQLKSFRQKISTIRSNLQLCKNMLICRKIDLKKMWNDQLEQSQVAQYINMLSEVKEAPNCARKLLTKEDYIQACQKLVYAANVLEDDLSSLTSLSTLKTEINSLLQKTYHNMAANLNELIYSHQFQTDGEISLIVDIIQKSTPNYKKVDPAQIKVCSLLLATQLLGRIPDLLCELKTKLIHNLYTVAGETVTTESKSTLSDFLDLLCDKFKNVGQCHVFVLNFVRSVDNADVYEDDFVWSKICEVLQDVVMLYLKPENDSFSSIEFSVDENSFIHSGGKLLSEKLTNSDISGGNLNKIKIFSKPKARNILVVLKILRKHFEEKTILYDQMIDTLINQVFMKTFFDELKSQVIKHSRDIAALSVTLDRRTQNERSLPKFLLESHVFCYYEIICTIGDCFEYLSKFEAVLFDLLLKILQVFQGNCQICVKKLMILESSRTDSSFKIFNKIDCGLIDKMMTTQITLLDIQMLRFLSSLSFSSKWLTGQIERYISHVSVSDEATKTAFDSFLKDENEFSLQCRRIVQKELYKSAVSFLSVLCLKSSYDCLCNDVSLDINVTNFIEHVVGVNEEFEQIFGDDMNFCDFCEDLDDVVAYLLMRGVSFMARINENGLKKMMRNILALQQMFLTIFSRVSDGLERCEEYYKLLQMDEADIFFGVMETGGAFPFEFYKEVIELRMRSGLCVVGEMERIKLLSNLKSMLPN